MGNQVTASVTLRLGERSSDLCGSGLECSLSETAAEPTAVLLAVAFSATFLLGLSHLSQARDVWRTERRQTSAERDAFERFSDRLRSQEPASIPAGPTDSGAMMLSTGGSDSGLEQVETAYRETVMDVPHYDDQYGDTILESLSEEFGPDIAMAVVTNETLSPQLRQTLLNRSANAQRGRKELLETVEAEQNSVETGAAALERLDRQRVALVSHLPNNPPVTAIGDVWRGLQELETRIGPELTDRQAFVRDPRISPDGRVSSFQEYLYSSLEVSHPLLASGAELGETLRRDCREMSRLIASTD